MFTPIGVPFLWGNVTKRGLDKGAAKLNRVGEPKVRMHDLHHCFASMLIAAGADVVLVARQLGHANPPLRSGSMRICSTPKRRARGCGTPSRPASVVTPW
jgi:hypothetical protein